MIYGYARCSTNESKQDINRQKRELKKLGATDKTIYFEYESGTRVDRPELLKMLDVLKQGDTIIATEISRLTRSTKQLCDLIDFCKDKKIKLVIQNSITIDCSKGEIDPMTKAFLQISGVFSELERNMTSERVKSGMANAKAKGVHIGRFKTTKDDIPPTFKKNYEKYYLTNKMNISEISRLSNISRPTAYKYIKILNNK